MKSPLFMLLAAGVLASTAFAEDPAVLASARMEFEKDSARAVAPVRVAYVKRLEAMLVGFTKLGKLEEAIAVKTALQNACLEGRWKMKGGFGEEFWFGDRVCSWGSWSNQHGTAITNENSKFWHLRVELPSTLEQELEAVLFLRGKPHTKIKLERRPN